ncbi:Delta-aminolevulinic acid dehydratase [Schistosoma japonicum]|uniref:Delta-aminolevulinic acid dehydratase n=1 Tax=Schistosoma japonicum TaxID=6182 RepID=A0A4Z2DCX6_SCHJA|nr:Delta-aminolevulinic acid dehydratase [Schistosoma japonicum]KAH8868997.1 Delta-aminolevulinic acid dehydratase [Schistosoma japonicum]KAH8869000.1 Delta-aminolevulinic acid dehydratase [Schistosoma japonicum]TNN14060.1 Delta-aminolevulinic acid dehydratase [Schistosoma japonicum]
MHYTHPLHSSYSKLLFRQWHSADYKFGAENLVYPIFLSHDPECDVIITSLIDQRRIGCNRIIEFLAPLVAKQLKSVLLFGTVNKDQKDATGSACDAPNSPVIQAIKLLKSAFPNLVVICDVCLCAYTDSGHCGILRDDGCLDVPKTVERLAEISKRFALEGADVIAPSDMMDGRVKKIKMAIESIGLTEKVAVMSYSAKFASCLYGPFRDAAQSAPSFGDRRHYQLPPGAKGLALRAAIRDANEGADFIMVKPGLPYLDIINELRQLLPHHPLAVYHVSGEYAMLKHAANAGALDLKQAALELMTSFRRAGASIIVTYLTPYLLELDLSESCK